MTKPLRTRTAARAEASLPDPSPTGPTPVESPPVPAQDGSVSATLHARLVRRKLVDSSVTLLVFVALFAGFGIWLGGTFVSGDARLLDVHQYVPVMLLGIAVLVTLIPGMFDLSVGGVATLACFLTIGLTVQQGWSFPVVLVVVITVGLAVGLLNGVLVEVFNVNAFIATLGTGGICTGLSAVYSGGAYVGPSATGPTVPNWFAEFGAFASKAPVWVVLVALAGLAVGLYTALNRVKPRRMSSGPWLAVRLGVLAVIVVILVLVGIYEEMRNISVLILFLFFAAAAVWVLMQHTTFGRHVQAVGSNRAAAKLAGVKVRRQVMKSFVLGGAIAAVAGVTLAASQGSAAPGIAESFLLPAFAAAFLSTVVLSDGRFTVPGTIIGGVFVVWVGQALVIGGMASTWVPVVNGLVLVIAVALSTALRVRR